MSILQRARLIQFNRQQRKHRHAVITTARQSAIRHSAAFQPFTLAPAPPSNGIGAGHEAFNLGPITFCRRCGATKSLSQGHSLRRPCRRWAPLGTRAQVKCLLQGRPPPFYRRILREATIPVKRLRQKTAPSPRFVIPTHLRHHDAPPAAPPPPPIELSRHTVHLGASCTLNTSTP